MNNKSILVLAVALLAVSLRTNAGLSDVYDSCRASLLRTRLVFHVSCLYNRVINGSWFSCDKVTEDSITLAADVSVEHPRPVVVEYDENQTALKTIADGKAPVVLGSMPREKSNVEKLRQDYGPAVGIYTLNEEWECETGGLSDLVKNEDVVQYKYPTPDFTPPTIKDLTRIVHDLASRPAGQAAYVHCKAGRGRSATAVAAYIAHLTQQAGRLATTEQIEAYLKVHRPRVDFSSRQRESISTFIEALQRAGSLEALEQAQEAGPVVAVQEAAHVEVQQEPAPMNDDGWWGYVPSWICWWK